MGPSINYVMPRGEGRGGLRIYNKLLFAHLKIVEINGKNMTRGEGIINGHKKVLHNLWKALYGYSYSYSEVYFE